MAQGVLSEDELAVVLAEQGRTGRLLGELVVALGFASSQAVNAALAEQKGWSKAEHALPAPPNNEDSSPPTGEAWTQDVGSAATTLPLTDATQAAEPDEGRNAGFHLGDLPSQLPSLDDVIGREGEIAAVRPALGAIRLEPHLLDSHSVADGAEETKEEQPDVDRHLVLLPAATGYQLLEREGTAPAVGTTIRLSQGESDVWYLVLKTTRAPLPGGRLRCAYLHAV